jgi:hypothetical protein
VLAFLLCRNEQVHEGVRVRFGTFSPVFWFEIFLQLNRQMHSVWVFQYFRSIGKAAIEEQASYIICRAGEASACSYVQPYLALLMGNL